MLTTKNYVASSLASEDESDTLECPNKLLPGDIGRELHYRFPVMSSTYSLPASVGTGSPDAMQSST